MQRNDIINVIINKHKSMELLWSGFTSTVHLNEDKKTVTKERNNWKPYPQDIVNIQKNYQKYIWNIAWVSIKKVTLSNDSMEITQDYVNWECVDLLTTTNEKIFELLEASNSLEQKEKILFDIFWIEWLIRLFIFFNKDNFIWKSEKIIHPIASKILNLIFKFPEAEYKKIASSSDPIFQSKNIIEDWNWELNLIDLENRKFTDPLNKLWHIFTKKAIKHVQENNSAYREWLTKKKQEN